MKNIRNEEITFINCNLCGSDDTVDIYFFKDYKYVQCLTCGLIYQNPQPHFNPLKNRYSEKYFYYEFENHHNFFELMRKTLHDIKFHEKISKEFISGKKFLDIGCATGLLLNYIRQYGWDVQGIEIDKYSVQYAKKNFNLNIINKPLEDVEIQNESFHVIHWSHVIEHLPSPVNGLKKIYKMLKKNGYMLLTTPRADSFQQNLFKQNWRSYHRDHVTIFSRKTLCEMVQQTGFEILNFFSWGGIEKGKTSLFFKNIADKTMKLINKGDVMFILARKK